MMGSILNLTGRKLTTPEMLAGVGDPGPHTDSVVAAACRGANECYPETAVDTLLTVAIVEKARAAMIDGPDWLVQPLARALLDNNIQPILAAALLTPTVVAARGLD